MRLIKVTKVGGKAYSVLVIRLRFFLGNVVERHFLEPTRHDLSILLTLLLEKHKNVQIHYSEVS